MSILQIEVSDETRAQIEIHAIRDSCTPQKWLARWIEKSLEEPLPEEEWITEKLLEAINDPRPPIVADAAFWKKLEEDVMAQLDAERALEEAEARINQCD